MSAQAWYLIARDLHRGTDGKYHLPVMEGRGRPSLIEPSRGRPRSLQTSTA